MVAMDDTVTHSGNACIAALQRCVSTVVTSPIPPRFVPASRISLSNLSNRSAARQHARPLTGDQTISRWLEGSGEVNANQCFPDPACAICHAHRVRHKAYSAELAS